jgi:hypothetical protein
MFQHTVQEIILKFWFISSFLNLLHVRGIWHVSSDANKNVLRRGKLIRICEVSLFMSLYKEGKFKNSHLTLSIS